MHIINVFIQLSVICIASSIKSHIPTKLFKHTNIINKTINKSIYHVGLMITISSSTIFSTTNLLPPSLSSTSFLSQHSVAYAVGPTQVPLTITSYKAVELCDGRKPIMPGQKAMEGLFPVCVEVEADVINPKSTPLTDVSVYGFVKDDDAGNSVLPNNPDFKSDSGQYAMIKVVPPGNSHITYQFVAAVTNNPAKVPLGKLTFFKTKAVAFPGGDRFKALTECEVDPRAEGCSSEDDDE